MPNLAKLNLLEVRIPKGFELARLPLGKRNI